MMGKFFVLTISAISLMTVIACQNKPVIEDQDSFGMESSFNNESDVPATYDSPELTSTDVAMNDAPIDESSTSFPEPEAPEASAPSSYESLGASSSGLGR